MRWEEERAREIRDFLEQKVNEIEAVTAKMPDEEKPKVYVASPYNLNSVVALATDVEIAGGKTLSVYCKSWACGVSFEQIASWNPDVILLHAYSRFMPEDLKKSPDWQKIEAVKEGRVYRILFGYTGKDPGLFVVNVLTEAKVIHPDKFDYNLEKEANAIFRELYGVDGLYTKLKEDFKLSEV